MVRPFIPSAGTIQLPSSCNSPLESFAPSGTLSMRRVSSSLPSLSLKLLVIFSGISVSSLPFACTIFKLGLSATAVTVSFITSLMLAASPSFSVLIAVTFSSTSPLIWRLGKNCTAPIWLSVSSHTPLPRCLPIFKRAPLGTPSIR